MRWPPGRGRFLPLAGAVVAVFAAFAACGDEEGDGGPPADQSPAPPSGERIQGGALRVHGIEPQSLDPHFSSFAQDISFERMVWRGLYSLDTDNVPQPAMADGEPGESAAGQTFTG